MASRSRARFRAGGRRLTAQARAIASARASGKTALIFGRPGDNDGTAFKDRAMTQPWVYPFDLEQPALAVIPRTALPAGVRPWTLGTDLLNGAGEFNSAAGWTLSPGISISGGRLTSASPTNGAASFTLPGVIPGKVYVVTVTQVSYASGSPFMTIGQGPATPFGSAFFGARTFVVTAGSADSVFRIYSGHVGVGGSQVFESVTVQEVIYDWSWLGPNLVTNGTFQTDTSGWTPGSSPTLAVGANGVTITNAGTTQGFIYQAISGLVVGKSYRISASITFGGTGFARVEFIGPAISPGGGQINVAASGTYFWVLQATATTMHLVCGNRNDTNASHTYGNITVQEIPGCPMTSPTAGGVRPSGRVNLLQRTRWTGAVSGTPGTFPAGWGTAFNTGTLNDLGGGVLEFSTSASRHVMSQAISVSANTSYRATLTIHQNSGLQASQIFAWIHSLTGSTEQVYVNGVLVNAGSYVPQPGDYIAYILNVGATAGTVTVRFGAGCSNTSTGTVRISSPDIRLSIYTGSAYPVYQWVNDGSNGVFDYDHAGFPCWAAAAATNAGLHSVGLVGMTGTDAARNGAVLAKTSDASVSIVAELSPNAGSSANPGSLFIAAPASTGGGAQLYAAASRGSSAFASAVINVAAPDIAALSARANTTNYCEISRNGGAPVVSSLNQGGGNYGLYRYYAFGRWLDGTAALTFTGRLATWAPHLCGASALTDAEWDALLREDAAAVGLTY